MAYGIIKVDTLTFTDGGLDKSVSISGLVQNPTFTGNVTATGTVSGNIILGGTTVSGATITGTTINATTGNFTTVSGGTISISSGVIASGTAANPSLSIAGDSDTGLYSPGADQLAISTAGTGRLFVNASGQVGIGTSSPATLLHVAGTQTVNERTTYKQSDNTTDVGSIGRSSLFITGGGTNDMGISSADALLFAVNGLTEAARFDSAGRLLLGYAATADLNCTLQVHNNSGNNTQLFRSSADANGPCLNLTKSRGTAAAPTEVSSGDELGIIRFRGYDGAAWQTAAQIQGFANGTWTDAGDTTDNPGSLVFSTVPDGSSTLATRMTIDNSGRILVATAATPSDATAVIRGGPGGTNGAHLQLTHGTSPYGGGRISVTNTGGDLAFYTHTGDVGGETYSERLRITSTGNIQIGANGNITADFSNATVASRTYFQTTTANSITVVGAIPNGTSASSALFAFNNSTPTNAAYVGHVISNTAATLRSAVVGTGTLLPLTFEVGSGTEVARMDTSGRLLVGTSTARSNFNNLTTTALIQAEGTAGAADRGMISVVNNSTADDPPWVYIAKSNGASVGSNTLVGSTTWLGVLGFAGNDGTDFVTGAHIAAQVDGTPGANDMPCRLLFSTTADGAANPTERARITSDGYLRLAATNSLGIQFNGDTAAANALDDYEEGTWTPAWSFAVSGSVTYSGQLGEYVKIGNTVIARGFMSLSAVSSPTGTVTITGLPFTSGNRAANYGSGFIGIARSFASAGLTLRIYITNNTTVMQVAKNDTNSVGTQVQGSDLTATTTFYFTIIYAV